MQFQGPELFTPGAVEFPLASLVLIFRSVLLPKIPNQASHHMVTLHRNMTCRSLKRLGAAKGLEDGHMKYHEYMLMCYTRPTAELCLSG